MSRQWKQLLLFLFFALFLVVVPVVALIGLMGKDAGSALKGGNAVVVIDIDGELLDYQPYSTPLSIFTEREPDLTGILSTIKRASEDGRVQALILRIFPSGAGAAKCGEIRAALGSFRETGKKVIAYSPVLVGNHYMLACGADSIFMPPSGYLVIPGPASSAVFIRGMLDKLGINPNIHRIGDYKSAAEMITETGRTPESRRMTQWLLEDMYEGFVASVASDRGRSEDTVRTWIDRGLYSPRRALENGLIDGMRHWDQVRGSLEGGDVGIIPASDYLKGYGPAYGSGSGPAVAVVHAQGEIVMGERGWDAFTGQTAGTETVIRELKRARRNGRIKAVILRIDSPGGDGIAGGMISREVEMTSRVKPVVVSMSDVAASGGYEIAYRADRIIAMPSSITGSIGSITGKMNMRGLYGKIGVTKDEMGVGDNALILSDYRDFSESEWDVLREEHWEFYRNWIEEIARFRDMRIGEVDSVARGRVWTGRQAEEVGLVDGTGGIDRAFEVACELAGIDDPEGVHMIHMPGRIGLLRGLFSGRTVEDTAARLLYRMIGRRFNRRSELIMNRKLPEEFEPGGGP